MELSNQRKTDRNTVIALIPVVAILGKIVQLLILPDKYFYDSRRMVGMLTKEKGRMAGWIGYKSTVDIFKKIDFFKFKTVTEWSIALGLLGTIIIIILVSKCKEMNKEEALYTLMAVGLLNIYSFNIAKEPIQFTFFLFVFIIIALPFKNTLIKALGCAGIFYWESNTYRSYYILMAAMILVLYLVFYLFRFTFKKINAFKIIIATAMCFVAMFIFVFASQYVDKKAYNDVITTKDTHGNEGADSAITNVLESDGSYPKFMINYVINAVRMMIPIELIFKSPGYAPFVLYQFFILRYWIRAIKNIKEINNMALLSLICFTSYLFGSFVFEPDYGSWVRHESASFPVFFVLAYEDLSLKKPESEEYETENVEYIY